MRASPAIRPGSRCAARGGASLREEPGGGATLPVRLRQRACKPLRSRPRRCAISFSIGATRLLSASISGSLAASGSAVPGRRCDRKSRRCPAWPSPARGHSCAGASGPPGRSASAPVSAACISSSIGDIAHHPRMRGHASPSTIRKPRSRRASSNSRCVTCSPDLDGARGRGGRDAQSGKRERRRPGRGRGSRAAVP